MDGVSIGAIRDGGVEGVRAFLDGLAVELQAGSYRPRPLRRVFHAVDMYVAQRMARLASIKHGLQGINWAQRFNYDWFQTLGVHRLTRPVGQRGAHA